MAACQGLCRGVHPAVWPRREPVFCADCAATTNERLTSAIEWRWAAWTRLKLALRAISIGAARRRTQAVLRFLPEGADSRWQARFVHWRDRDAWNDFETF